jgi:hypothetical protein
MLSAGRSSQEVTTKSAVVMLCCVRDIIITKINEKTTAQRGHRGFQDKKNPTCTPERGAFCCDFILEWGAGVVAPLEKDAFLRKYLRRLEDSVSQE